MTYPDSGGTGALAALAECESQPVHTVTLESERQFRGVFELAPLVAVIVNLQGCLTFANDMFASLTEWRKDEALGKHFNEFVAPEVREEVGQVFNESIETGVTPPTYEVDLITKSGERRTLSLSTLDLRDAEGRLTGIAAIGQDVTARTQLLERIKEAGRLSDALNHINKIVHATPSMDVILTSVIEQASRILGAECALVHLKRGSAWVPGHVFGCTCEVFGKTCREEEMPHALLSVREREPVAVDDAFNDPRTNTSVMRNCGIRSVLTVPLIVNDRPIGVMFFNYISRAVHFTENQVDFGRKLANTVSLALENARLREAEARIADTLQESILRMPDEIPGVVFGSRYESATEAARVGGDFFDLFEVMPGCFGAVIGDVAGHGVESAGIAAGVKSAVKAYALDGFSSAYAVSRADKLIAATPDFPFVTLFLGIMYSDWQTLSYCSAGNPPPLLLRKDGALEELAVRGLPAGTEMETQFQEGTVRFGHGDLLVLYTDGVIEARRGEEMFGIERLADLVREMKNPDPRLLPDEIIREVTKFSGGVLRDDAAVLCVSLNGQETCSG